MSPKVERFRPIRMEVDEVETDKTSSSARRAGGDSRNDPEVWRIRKSTTVTPLPVGNQERTSVAEAVRARGGLSAWSVLSGILVAFGAFVLLSALVGAILAGSGLIEGSLRPEELRTAGIGTLIALVIIQFLAYFWGGYTSARMARGSGWMNGLLVTVGAIVIVAVLGAVVAGLSVSAPGSAPTGFESLPSPFRGASEVATAAGIAILASMLLGGLLGGRVGAKWHTKLENDRLRSVTREAGEAW